MRRSAVATSDTSVAPAAAASATASASNPGSTVRAVPVARARVTTESPPTWESGRQASQWSSAPTPRRLLVATRRRPHRVVGEHDALGLAGRSARGDDECVAGFDRPPAGEAVLVAVGSDQRRRRDGRQQAVTGRGGEPPIDGKRGVAAVPHPAQRVDERRPARQVEGDELRPALTAPMMACLNRWILGARPRTLPAAVVPVAVGAGAAVGRRPAALVARSALALVVSLALQVGVNYANDYSDGVRGTDDVRVGPVRLVASGCRRAGSREAGGAGVVRRGRGRRPGAGGDDVVVVARRRGGEHRRRVGLHRRAAALRLPRARRGVRVRVLRAGRHRRHDLRRRRDDHRR